MLCEKCRENIGDNENICSKCLKKNIDNVLSDGNEMKFDSKSESLDLKKRNTNGKIRSIFKVIGLILIVVMVVFLKFSGYFNEKAIDENNEALVLLSSGEADDAAIQLEEALKKTSDKNLKITLLKNLAYAYWDQSNDDLALQTFKKAKDLTEKNSFDYYFISGEIFLLENNYEKALDSYNEALKINSKDFQVHNSLFNFYIEESEYLDYKKALEHAKKANNYSDGASNKIALKNLGVAYYFNGEFEESLKIFLTMDLENEPDWNVWVGWCYAMMGDVENSVKYFKKAESLGVDLDVEVEEYLREHL